MVQAYTEAYYRGRQAGSRSSAEAIVPFVFGLVKPSSVVDVGCGTGTWLAVFRELGVEHVLGIDGEHVDRRLLEIPDECFIARDLSATINLDRTFDLVVSLEVAEHLPRDHAPYFVRSLLQLGRVVLFSAAIPHQGGRGHVNEQWPEYWAHLFEEHDYVVVDCLRRKVWQDERVQYWYAQNTLLFVAHERLAGDRVLQHMHAETERSQLSIVHPKKYLELVDWCIADREK
jgi:SAM-dependent methyltransferase